MTPPLHGGRSALVVANEAAGRRSSQQLVGDCITGLQRSGIPTQLVSDSDPWVVRRTITQAVADGVDTVVVIGGDGSFHLGVNAVAGTSARLGLIPAGTGNDAARALGLPRDDPSACLDRIIAGATRRLDLARVGDTHFFTVLAAGFDAVVNERANQMSWPQGQARYTLATVIELGVFKPLPYTLELDGRVVQTEAMMVAVANTASFGGGLRIAEGAVADDGLLDVIVIEPMSKLELLRTYPKLFKGTHVSHPKFTRHLVRRASIAAPGVVSYADGERLAPLPVTVECRPLELEVFA